MKIRGAAVVVAAACVAGPALAERAFVPMSESTGRGVDYRTEIALTNEGGRDRAVWARLGYEAGGASAAQAYTVFAGGTTRLDGLTGNGLVELELAKDVAVDARLLVVKPDGRVTNAALPVLTAADSLPAGARALVHASGLASDYRNLAVGVVNLGGRALRCSASFESDSGEALVAPVEFAIAPRTERRSDSFVAGRGPVDADALTAVSCDQPFWAYALAESARTGDARIVYPTREVVAEATEATAGSLVFQLPGTFFTPSSAKWSYRYTMSFGSTRTFHKLATDLDVYIAKWDPQKPGGNHLIQWVQMAKWGTMMMYLQTTRGNGTKYSWNFSPGNNAPKKASLKVLNTYHARVVWDGFLKKNGYAITKAGLPVINSSNTLGVSTFTAPSVFVEFAHSNNGPAGPESRSPGWKYSNWRAEFFD